MVQNMIRSDPRFASNPMAQQAMERMANDPQMAAMMAQMMSDPQALEQLRALAPGGGGMNGAPPNPAQMAQMMNMFGSVAPAAAGMNRPGGNNSQPQPSNNNNSGGGGGGGANDEDLTEEGTVVMSAAVAIVFTKNLGKLTFFHSALDYLYDASSRNDCGSHPKVAAGRQQWWRLVK